MYHTLFEVTCELQHTKLTSKEDFESLILLVLKANVHKFDDELFSVN